MLNYSEIKEIEAGTIEYDDDFLMANGIRLVLVPMPYEIKGRAIPCGNWYQVEINSRIPDDQKWSAFLHELWHIAGNDFDSEDNLDSIELNNPY